MTQYSARSWAFAAAHAAVTLYEARFDTLLNDKTASYFDASDPPFEGKRHFWLHGPDNRSDCVQVVIALIVTPQTAYRWPTR